MAIVANDIKSKLSELKKRAAQRKNVKTKPSKNYLKELESNSAILHKYQYDTIKDD